MSLALMPFAVGDGDPLFKISAIDIHENRVPIAVHAEGVDLELHKVFASASSALSEVQILDVLLATIEFLPIVILIHCLPPLVIWSP